MTWAEKLRRRAPSEVQEEVALPAAAFVRRAQKGLALSIPADLWLTVLHFLPLEDICARFGPCCRYFWSCLRVDSVWKMAGERLREQMFEIYGNGLIPELTLKRYFQTKTISSYKVLHRQFTADLRRCEFLEEKVAESYQPRSPFRMVFRYHNPLPATQRIVLSSLALFHITERVYGREVLSTNQLATVCDNIRAGEIGMIPYSDVTAVEDVDFVSMLHHSLSPDNPGDNILHNMGPRVSLLEINRTECETVSKELRLSEFLSQFVIDPETTRYFVSPQLAHGDAFGFIAVDTVRILVCQQR
jgi:hypothetical protein